MINGVSTYMEVLEAGWSPGAYVYMEVLEAGWSPGVYWFQEAGPDLLLSGVLSILGREGVTKTINYRNGSQRK